MNSEGYTGFILCCGHKVRELSDGVHICFKDYIVDRGDMEHGGGMGEVSGVYCKKCATEYIRHVGAWII
jgi:hypothetical protein